MSDISFIDPTAVRSAVMGDFHDPYGATRDSDISFFSDFLPNGSAINCNSTGFVANNGTSGNYEL
jgi:hypothetical protein